MIRRPLVAFALLAAPVFAQTSAPSPTIAAAPLPAPAPGIVRVALTTSDGPIILDLEAAKAPITTANFLRYVDQHRLDGIVFYRAVKVQPNFGFVQFGVQNAPKRVLPPIKHEPTTITGVHHTDGAISLARLEPGSGRGDFTISVGDNSPSFDADPSKPGDNLGYAAFGHVVGGMGVVQHLLDAPTDPAKGPFKGEMIAAPVKVISARRVTG